MHTSSTARPTRLRRVELSVPASSEKMIVKAAALGADVVIFDLEDSVVASEKTAARLMVAQALNSTDFGRSVRAVRVNAPGTEWAHGDVIELLEQAGAKIDVIVIPKVLGPRDVWFVDTLLTELEARLGLTNRIGLEVLIEEAQALARVEEIAACCDRLEALTLGTGDLAASLGLRVGSSAENGYPFDIWHGPRSRLVAAARANGLDAIEGPYLDFRDVEGVRRSAVWAAAMGCAGMWAIHPTQIDVGHEVFAPTAAEIAAARSAISALADAQAAGAGAANHNGNMLDAATTRIHQGVLDRAALGGLTV